MQSTRRGEIEAGRLEFGTREGVIVVHIGVGHPINITRPQNRQRGRFFSTLSVLRQCWFLPAAFRECGPTPL
jgi:hypothetical protein